ncbi:hypothetical protein CsSME_00017237 [Camellia sinensis var. sinensis]
MSNLDMSLDDIIKMNKKSGGGGGGGGGGGANPRGRARNSGPGPARRLPNRSSNRTTPYSAGKVQAPETTWQHDMFADHATAAYPAQVGRVSAIETGTKLFISNLDYGVSNEDIKYHNSSGGFGFVFGFGFGGLESQNLMLVVDSIPVGDQHVNKNEGLAGINNVKAQLTAKGSVRSAFLQNSPFLSCLLMHSRRQKDDHVRSSKSISHG